MTREELRDFTVFTAASGRKLYGERVAVVADEGDDMYSDHIIKPDTEKTESLTGTVVATGLAITPKHKMLAGLNVGDVVAFNTYSTLEMLWPTDDKGGTQKVKIFHATDIYVGWRPDKVFLPEDLND